MQSIRSALTPAIDEFAADTRWEYAAASEEKMGVTSITDRSMKNVLLCGFVISCLSVFSASEWATPQEPEAAKQTVPTPRIPSTGFAGLDNYRASRIATFTDDFGQLTRYRSANDALASGAPAKGRVVFFGDSITDTWKLENYFAGRAYVNRGIGGQTTPQMLVRFRQDVIDLSPTSVVILAGTNDIAGNTGPMRNEDIVADLATMAELAKSHRIAAIVASILPVHNYTPRSQDFFAQRPVQRILDVNRSLKDYCAKNRIVYLDYFSAMVDEKGLLREDLAEDGLHPNDAGYRIMAPLAEAAIAKATASRGRAYDDGRAY